MIWHNATVAGLCAAGYRPDTNRYRSDNAKSAQTDRATRPLTTYPRAKRPGICEESYSLGRFETMKNFTRGE